MSIALFTGQTLKLNEHFHHPSANLEDSEVSALR